MGATANSAIPSLKDMLSSVLQESEEAVKTSSAAEEGQPTAAEETATPEASTQTEGSEESEVKLASADLVAFADELDALGDQYLGTSDGHAKEASATDEKGKATPLDKEAAMKAVLAKLGAGDTAPQHAPQAETNLDTKLKGKEPKKDSSRNPSPPMKPGTEDKTRMQSNAEQDTPGKTPDNIMKTSASERSLKLASVHKRMLEKLSGDDVSTASISTGKTAVNPEDEAAPVQPQQGDRAMIGSNEAAIGFTKGQAKATPKKVLKGVLDEPALSKATDSKLHENLAHASAAGVKISAAKRERLAEGLRKVASRVGTPEHAWLVEQVHQIREKRAAADRNKTAVRAAMKKKNFFGPDSY